MHHIGYQTHHLPTGRYYIGIHSTDNLEDGYLGSGPGLKAAVKRHGRAEFRRRIVKEFATRAEACEWEAATVTMQVVEDPRSFNLQTGGGIGRRGVEARGNISEAVKRAYTDNPAFRVTFEAGRAKAAEKRRAPVEVNGVRYNGQEHAALALGVHRNTVAGWVQDADFNAARLPRGPAPVQLILPMAMDRMPPPKEPVELAGVDHVDADAAAEEWRVDRWTILLWVATGHHRARYLPKGGAS